MAYVLASENVDSNKYHWFNIALRQSERRDFDTFENVVVHDLRISMDSETVSVSLSEKSLRALAAELASYVGALDLDARAQDASNQKYTIVKCHACEIASRTVYYNFVVGGVIQNKCKYCGEYGNATIMEHGTTQVAEQQ